MHHDDQEALETLIDRELKALPDLQAPARLVPAVMRVLQARQRVPWYRQSWSGWPMPMRAFSFLLLLSLFVGICLAGWQLGQVESVAAIWTRLSAVAAGVGALWNALGVVLRALTLAVTQIGPGWVAASLLAMTLGYAMCVGMGTLYLRLALARR